MACGCKKGVTFRSRTPTVMPVSRVRSTQGGIAAGLTPTQINAQSMTPTAPINNGALTAEKRKVQAQRRQAIRNALGK